MNVSSDIVQQHLLQNKKSFENIKQNSSFHSNVSTTRPSSVFYSNEGLVAKTFE
jgi:hypothetical protein